MICKNFGYSLEYVLNLTQPKFTYLVKWLEWYGNQMNSSSKREKEQPFSEFDKCFDENGKMK